MRNKDLTPEAAEARHHAAIRGLENLGLFDKADEIASLDPIEYVESKGYQVQNPTLITTQRRTQKMALTRAELLAENQELKEENERLADIVDSVASLVSTDEDDDDYEDEEDDE